MSSPTCPRCSQPTGIGRLCGACGFDLTPELTAQGFLPPTGAAPTSFGAPLPAPPAPGFRSPRTAGIVALCLLGLAGFLCAAAALLDSLWLIETGRADADFAVHLELIERLDAVNQLQLLSLVAAAIAFIVWLWQAYGNMRPLGIANPRYARGWAIAGWFVPVANLVIPKLLANDVWRAGDPDLAPGERNWQARRVAPLVHWWWALYLVRRRGHSRRAQHGGQRPVARRRPHRGQARRARHGRCSPSPRSAPSR